MRVIRKRPGYPAEEIEIENSLKALQHEVGGYIETVTFMSDCVVICDEEGRLKNKPINCSLCGVDFVGTIIVAGVGVEDFCDVPQGAAEVFFGINEKAPAEAATSYADAQIE